MTFAYMYVTLQPVENEGIDDKIVVFRIIIIGI